MLCQLYPSKAEKKIKYFLKANVCMSAEIWRMSYLNGCHEIEL